MILHVNKIQEGECSSARETSQSLAWVFRQEFAVWTPFNKAVKIKNKLSYIYELG
jgi:hypothetical protein